MTAWVKATNQDFHKLSIRWSPTGWWTTMNLPDFPRRQFITHKGNYLDWRITKYKNRMLYELGHDDWRKPKPKNPNKNKWRQPRGRNEVRTAKLLKRMLEEEALSKEQGAYTPN